jgi:hypothetical protein
MNKQLDELQQVASYYTPSKTVTLAAGEEKDIIYRGLNSRRYGVNRILVGGTSLTDVVATASFNNGRDKKFENVHLSTLRTLFFHRSLRGAFEIGDSTEMKLTLKNLGAGENTVNVMLVGYDDAHLQLKQDQYAENQCAYPQPEFIYIEHTAVPAATQKRRISVKLPAYPLRLYRMAMGVDDAGDNLLVSVRQDQVLIKPEIFVDQLNDEFSNMDIILPQTLQAHTPFDLYVTNTSPDTAYHVSLLAECYKL